MRKLVAILIAFVSCFVTTVSAQTSTILYPQSPLRVPIPSNATYTRESRIGSIRQGTADYSVSVYRIDTDAPDYRLTVSSSGRVVNCDMPLNVTATDGEDHHLDVINTLTGQVCELFGGQTYARTGATSFTGDGAQLYAIAGTNGNGITSNSNWRTTASGFSVIAGAVTLEDVADIQAGFLSHGLNFALPPNVISQGFIAPAIGGEQSGRAGTGGIPMGARYALPRDYVVPTNLNPFTQVVLQAFRDYGGMVSDGNGAANYGGLAVGTFRIEPAAEMALYGTQDNPNVQCPNIVTASSPLRCIVQQQFYNEIARVGLFRITGDSGGVTSTPVVSATPTRTRTPAPTLIVPTRTGTPITVTPFTFTCVVTTPNPFTAICH